ncbi:M43 family zinc metalloprotease [Chryseobacterium caseinilyticum]|uniref:T9SS type A sorting domain-containing protein n=1 Tax=Chryseobacterium caseinilyticum TaxID=2771428 RepID=A0ABR8ZG88_9FLAO|nr:M43 family zinc metalloprotease [Chryseobacterium caseinilyticum]MBD8083818.1 T9SS type A sorting domain-containing protein [Chryseobacterium caseinilyticum]
MRKFTTFKFLFFLSMIFGGALNAQDAGKLVKKNGNFPVKNAEERSHSHGFDRCSTDEYEHYLQTKYPKRMSTQEFEAWLAPLVEQAKANKSQTGNIITIPVVIHVIHSGQNVGAAPNITDNQVISQITVMNNDFRRMAGTPGFNSNAVGADTQIQFALAKVDPNGNPTNGINRVNLCQDSWNQDEIDDYVKPTTIWDPTQYMNMWSVNFSDGGLLGYAQFPSNSGLGGLNPNGGLANTDGVVANFATFGSSTYNDGTFMLSAPYDKGRTMTHEVGHFLGLRHIWGDTSSCVVNATDSNNDFCLDTPAAAAPNFNCVTIDSCPANPGNDMIENYMDYTVDTCMNIFTVNQTARLTAVMNNSPRRNTLKTSTKDIAIPLFANDAEVKIDGGCAVGVCGGGVLRLSLYNRGTANLTNAVISYTFAGGAAQTYTWTGSLAQDKFSIITIPVDPSVPTSAVTTTITSVNGGADQRASNNSSTGTYTKPATPDYYNTTTVNFALQRDFYGSETKWTLKNAAGQVLYSGGPYADSTTPVLPALISQTWTLPLGCYVFAISDAYGDGLSSLDGGYVTLTTSSGTVIYSGSDAIGGYATKAFTNQVLSVSDVKKPTFNIYPNPASDVLNIQNVSDKATFEIHNAVGQLVKSGKIENGQVKVADFVKGVYVITVKDKNLTETLKFIKK